MKKMNFKRLKKLMRENTLSLSVQEKPFILSLLIYKISYNNG